MQWIIFGLLSALTAALVAIFGKLGTSHLDSMLSTTVRSLVMAVFLVITSLAFGKADVIRSIDGKAMFYIILSGVAGALSWLFYFYALKNGPVTGVVALDRLSVVFAVVLAVLFLGEKLSWATAGGAALMVAGAFFMVAR